MAFSAAGIEHPQAQLQLRLHDHGGETEHVRGAAHVLLHQRHAGGRLDVEAAGIEDDPLADQRDFGVAFRAPAHVDQAGRAVACRPDGVDHREVARERSPSTTEIAALKRSARPSAACARSCGERSFAGVLIRSRTRKTASRMRAERGGVGALRDDQPRAVLLRLAVAVEAIAREREGKRGELRFLDALGQAIRPAGSASASLPTRSGPRSAESAAPSPKSTRARLPSASGIEEMPARLGLEAGGDRRSGARARRGRQAPAQAPPPSPGGSERRRPSVPKQVREIP